MAYDGTWVIDLDGVIWLTTEAIPGGAQAVSQLRATGHKVLFATNNSAPTRRQFIERLERAGIDAVDDEVVTSAQAAASLMEPGEHALLVAEGGIAEALKDRGVEVVDDGPADAVIVGWTKHFDFDVLAQAAMAVRAGARLIATNLDPTHPTPTGLWPGSGALVAAVATAAETEPIVAGKPCQPMIDLIRARAATIALVVGDRKSTDGALAAALDVPFAWVRSGVNEPGELPAGALVADDLRALVAEFS